MANQFITLPAPAGNGAGAAVDVSTFGGLKTVASSGNGFTFEPTVTIEFSNELVPVNWAPLWTFGKPGDKGLVIAARWMRASVSNYRGGGSPVVDVGGTDSGAQFANLPVTPGNGFGAAVDVSALDGYKTIHVGSPFRGALNIEISEDGGATYSQVATFYNPGWKSVELIADFMRVRRSGVPQNSPGTPVVNIGAVDGAAGAPGVFVEDEGVPIGPNQFSTLNFQGGGVVASDAGGGQADILIPGQTYEDEGVPVAGAPHDTVDFVGAGVTVADAGGGRVTVTIPGAPPAATGSVMYWGCDSVGAAIDSRFIPPGYETGLAPTTDTMQIPSPRAATLQNLLVRHNAAGGNGMPVVYTVMVNGIATAITTALATGAIGQAGDTVNAAVIAQGDRISLRASKAAAIGAGVVDVQVSLEVA